ncbi:hypothetical protein [Gorillibacterium sp. CAU 1737]|uniref:hypothetical protein n=1 Tax=Gorillibacterium sp. CAU 1737 TaxID=3140362 RepID=UPI0032600EC6
MNVRFTRMMAAVLCFLMVATMVSPLPRASSASIRYEGMSLIEEWSKKAYEGRQAGTAGYTKAVDDLEKRLSAVGMIPVLEEGTYRQSYSVGTASLKSEKVALNQKTLKLMKDYMPYSRSAEGAYSFRSVYYAGAGLSSDYKTKVDGLVIFHWNDKNGKFPEGIQDRVQRAAANGAKGVLIVANGELKIGNYEHPLNAEKLAIPVLYITEAAADSAGVPKTFIPAALKKGEASIQLKIDRSTPSADNLVGVIPGKSEEKAILWVTNIDGFGSLPNGTWYESAKAGSVSAAMMLDMARYYRENPPEYTMIFAFVGSKWKGQEGIRALTEKLNFASIACTIDLYAMGGNGNLNDLYVSYTDPSFESFAKAVAAAPMLNKDLGNALSSVLKTKTTDLLLIRDQNTWVDDSSSDTAARVERKHYENGVNALLALSGKVMKGITEKAVTSFDYSAQKNSKVTLARPKLTLNQLETQHFQIYADDTNISLITSEVMKEMDSIYRRVAKMNYYPLPKAKVTALFMKDGNAAAQIAGRKDLETHSEQAGGGFASYSNGKMYIYMRSGPTYETIAHELNHAMASANPYAGDNFELQEWQGHSRFVRYLAGNGTYASPIEDVVKQRYLSNHEVPKLTDLIKGYKTALNWSWYTKNASNPDGHLYTYYLMGSMYAFLEEQYSTETARRAMYRNYQDVTQIQTNLIKDTGLSLPSFLENWSKWTLQFATSSASPASPNRKPGNTAYDYKMLYTLPSAKAGGSGNDATAVEAGWTNAKKGNVPYRITLSSKDLSITTLNLIKAKDGATIEIGYESKVARSISLFNPPDGDKIKVIVEQAIKPGKGKAILKLTNAQVNALRNEPMVTISFWGGEDFIVLENKNYVDLLK